MFNYVSSFFTGGGGEDAQETKNSKEETVDKDTEENKQETSSNTIKIVLSDTNNNNASTTEEISPDEPETGTSTMVKSSTTKARNKVALEPGHSPLDWARLTQSGKDLTGTGGRIFKVTLSELKKHNTEEDCWMVIRGKVYNATPYLKFHPGGMWFRLSLCSKLSIRCKGTYARCRERWNKVIW
jgi:hypothetical protein